MRSRTRVVCLLVVALSSLAVAKPKLLDEQESVAPEYAMDAPLTREDVQLAEYHGAAPIGQPPRPINPVAPVVNHARADFFLIGLALVGGGLVLGGAGFAVLYVCYSGGGCNDGITALGWILAAPGVIPLTIGLIMMYASSGARVRVEAPKAAPLQRWAFGFSPLKEGGFVSASSTF